MLFRRRMHRHWRERSHGEDSGAKGLKSAMVEWSHLWLVSTALAMTVAFAMLIGDHHKLPTGDDAIAEKIAAYLFIGFTLRAMYHSLFLIVACALWVQNTSSVPAADYSAFIRGCSVNQKPWITDPGDYVYMLYGNLMLAAGAFTYQYYGGIGLAMWAVAFYRFVKLCADNLIAWQNAMKGFEASLSVPEGTYVSSWAGYGQGCCGMTAAIWNTIVGPGTYGCFLGTGESRAAPSKVGSTVAKVSALAKLAKTAKASGGKCETTYAVAMTEMA